MSELFLNSTNVSNCNIDEVVESISDGTMTYGDEAEKYRVTKIEILNGGTINLYGAKLPNKSYSKEDIDEIADKVIDILSNNIRKGFGISEQN
jgi:hypothetical protein